MDSDYLKPNEKMINSKAVEVITFLPLTKLRYRVFCSDFTPAFLISVRARTDLGRQDIKSTCVRLQSLLRA